MRQYEYNIYLLFFVKWAPFLVKQDSEDLM